MYLLVLEDANLLLQLSRSREMTVMDDIFCNVRKGEIHVLAVTHSPSELSSGLLSNSANKIVFRLDSGRDVEAMQGHMGVGDREKKDYFYKLNQAEFEVIVEFTKRARPFVARIIKANLLKPMSKEELCRNNARIMQKFSVPVSRETCAEKKEQALTNDEKEFLMAVYLNQYRKTLTEIYGIAGFSACKGTKTTEKLENKGMIKIISLVKGKGVSKFPILLESTYKILNLEEKSFYGKGAGYEHIVFQYLVAEHFKAEIELNKFGKFIDVAVQHDNRLIAIEVAMTSVHEKENIERDFNIARADFVIIGCKDEKVLNEVNLILQGLDEAIKSKTRALLLSKILNMNLEELAKL